MIIPSLDLKFNSDSFPWKYFAVQAGPNEIKHHYLIYIAALHPPFSDAEKKDDSLSHLSLRCVSHAQQAASPYFTLCKNSPFYLFFLYLFEKHFDERITYHIKDKTNKQTTESITTPFSGKSTQVSCSVMCSVLNLVFRCCVFPGADPPFLQNLGCTIFALCTVIYYYICACDSTKTGENVARQSTRQENVAWQSKRQED